MKKMPGDIIILHMCTLNDSHICFLKYERNGIFCHFGPFFALLPTTTKKIKILKKVFGDINLHKCTKNRYNMLYYS